MHPIPILFYGDNPRLATGLARIGRDLATLVSGLPQFRVGYMGRGSMASSKLPFAQYPFHEWEEWGESKLEFTWRDFAGDDHGIIFTITDPSRLHWFANPNGIEGPLGDFLRSGKFERWGYFPVDSVSIGERLTRESCQTLQHYDRILAYTQFGAEVLSKSVGGHVEWIPHGMNLDVFTPRDFTQARAKLGVRLDDLVVGCVMTNQARKDWGLAFAIIARLTAGIPNVKFWAHVDTTLRHWDLRALVDDFRLDPQNVIITETGAFNDSELSYAYSACNLTILPSLGEGFGYPIVESLACGVPCIHGRYGGGVELIPCDEWLVSPVIDRLDTPYNCLRPVFDPGDWVETIERALQSPNKAPDFCRNSVAHLDWHALWPSMWKKWFESGVVI